MTIASRSLAGLAVGVLLADHEVSVADLRRFEAGHLENLAGLDRMPANGGFLVVGGARNRDAPSTILGLVP